MATIGLDRLYYSKITEDANGEETYGTPIVLAKAITAELSVELVEAILYADDGAAEVVKEFNSGTLTLGIDDIGPTVAADLTGATTDDNGVLISASENSGTPVAVGFRAQKANGTYRYFWLEFRRVLFRSYTVWCLDFQPLTCRQRLILSPFLHLPLKGQSCAAISWMVWENTRGKQRSPKVIQVYLPQLFQAGLHRYMNRSTRRSHRRIERWIQKEVLLSILVVDTFLIF